MYSKSAFTCKMQQRWQDTDMNVPAHYRQVWLVYVHIIAGTYSPDLTQNVALKQWPQRHFHGNAAWLGCSLCCAASQTSSTDGRAASVTGGLFIFHSERRIMRHAAQTRWHTGGTRHLSAPNLPLIHRYVRCDVSLFDARASHLESPDSLSALSVPQPPCCSSFLLSDQGTRRGVRMIPVTAIPLFTTHFL